MNYTGWTKTRLHIHLTELIEMELILLESTKKNQLQTYKLLYNGEGQDGRRFMLGLHGVQQVFILLFFSFPKHVRGNEYSSIINVYLNKRYVFDLSLMLLVSHCV